MTSTKLNVLKLCFLASKFKCFTPWEKMMMCLGGAPNYEARARRPDGVAHWNRFLFEFIMVAITFWRSNVFCGGMILTFTAASPRLIPTKTHSLCALEVPFCRLWASCNAIYSDLLLIQRQAFCSHSQMTKAIRNGSITNKMGLWGYDITRYFEIHENSTLSKSKFI